MKLQKVKSRKVRNSQYFKYLVVLPPKEVEKTGWKEGEELEIVERKKTLVLKAKR